MNKPINYEYAFDESSDTIPREIYEELKTNKALMGKLLP
jgi:hypothetical protein